ncbi:hypothetical protein Cabys_271 [Caldithrix abyssi DSM 13497]|uniref:Uncharacterized protein n=1 Tax=Caldithrix abyssi DSM 13497 TaxID=880073 RepID=A0A1J1C389_CALAY|nr:hypothetical protein Cabys_271 [Caldithrix abyssi DSM 13497]
MSALYLNEIKTAGQVVCLPLHVMPTCGKQTMIDLEFDSCMEHNSFIIIKLV